MIEYLIGGLIMFFMVLIGAYLYMRVIRKKHWSEGYVVLGKTYGSQQPRQEEQKTTGGTDSMFPPGWG